MLKVILTKEIPGSGKSYKYKEFVANNNNWKRINKDDLRNMIDGGKWSPKNEKVILEIRDELLLSFLDKGYNVIVDDTNIHHKHEQNIRRLIKGKAELEIDDTFLSVPLEVCIERDKSGENSVGEEVIRRMYAQLNGEKSKWEDPKKKGMFIAKSYKENTDLSSAIIVDMDGTLAIHNGRSPYEFDKCDTDIVNEPVKRVVNKFSDDYHIIVVSGRDDSSKDKTVKWLKDNDISFDAVYMRKTGDRRGDDIIKEEIYDKYIKDIYNILFVLDDRSRVVKVWRKLGLNCFQVAEGDF